MWLISRQDVIRAYSPNPNPSAHIYSLDTHEKTLVSRRIGTKTHQRGDSRMYETPSKMVTATATEFLEITFQFRESAKTKLWLVNVK